MRDFTAHYCTLLHIAFANIAHFGDFSTLPNVVGYAQNALQDGATIVASQFVGIGTEGGVIDLQSLKAVGEGCEYSVLLSKLSSFGVATTSYTWDGDGWTDETFEKVLGISVQPGEGLWIEGVSGQGVQSAGQVSEDDITVQLQAGATITGNPTPIVVDIQDITASEEGAYSIIASKLNSFGVAVASYTWDGEGWIDEGFEKVVDVSIQPGEGIWVEASDAGFSVAFPGVEL